VTDFDITKHKWWDSEPCRIETDGSLMLYPTEDDSLIIQKDDAIAIAKHFKLTEADLCQ